mgnify:CR=1 FL=1
MELHTAIHLVDFEVLWSTTARTHDEMMNAAESWE